MEMREIATCMVTSEGFLGSMIVADTASWIDRHGVGCDNDRNVAKQQSPRGLPDIFTPDLGSLLDIPSFSLAFHISGRLTLSTYPLPKGKAPYRP